MSREVTHDGAGTLQIRFPFDRELVDRIKGLPRRRWNAADRFWAVPEQDVVELVDLLGEDRFRFDAPTREVYARLGGTATLDAVQTTPANRSQPGLFDAPTGTSTSLETAAVEQESGDYSVSGLNERVGAAIRSAFPTTVWIVGEIAGFNKSAHRRHVSFELTEKTARGETVSKVAATLFESTRRKIESELSRAGDPFRLEDEITVRVEARVDLYAAWGQYRIVIEGLDVNYTLGEAARRREEIVRRLGEAGLVGRNTALPLIAFPLRVGVVTSIGSDACNDVLRTFDESGFAFSITVHGARVQGHATEASVLNALDWFRERSERFDVLLITRGGGSRTDLIWFDSEPLGRAVAEFPLPIVIGIGHEQDQSVLDAVARSCKTPTAAATLVVKQIDDNLERIELTGRALVEAAAGRIDRERRAGDERTDRLVRAARRTTETERRELAHRRERTIRATGVLVSVQRERLGRWGRGIPRGAALHVDRNRLALRGTLRSILHGARRDVESCRLRISEVARSVTPRWKRLLEHETERLELRDRRVRLVHPRRVLERGYAILRLDSGRLLAEASAAPAGTRVRAELRGGTLKLRSEGPDPERESEEP